MSLRAISFITFFAAVLLFAAYPGGAMAQSGRAIETLPDSDYFGFDLRTERDVTLDQCKTACLGDDACRAFTYNNRARWCFLKSDYSVVKPFAGAVAGKVVALAGDPDIGAPAELEFFPARMIDEARQYRARLVEGTAPREDFGLAYLLNDADNALATANPRQAVRSYAEALAITPDDWSIWTRLSRASLAIQPSNGSEKATLRRDATAAAWNAYSLSRTTAARAETLSVMAGALEARELFRPAIQAYEASLLLVDDAQVRAAYLDLRSRRGFRIVDHTVDADTASPRVCVQLSEDLVKAGVDYSSFVTLDGGPAPALDARERQICVEGLRHGRHYRVALRQGLPSAVGETLQSPVTLSIYIQDRPPSVRFTGNEFVLPGKARRGIPLVSVNTKGAKLALHRVGERGLTGLVTGYNFLSQLSGYGVSRIADDIGQPVWEGELEIASELNAEVVTSIPVDEALPKREPGIYVLTAIPLDGQTEYWDSRATQWFVISDIGLTTYAGEDGLNVFARSLASAEPLAGVELALLARNNEVLGSAVTDETGRVTFTPGLARGEGGMSPATITARSGEDFVFLDMTQGGFDLSDRGVTGREAPGAIDTFLWTERGIYRAGETVHATALLRDDRAVAVENMPVTFIFERPDGVEDRRIVSTSGSLGGHSVELSLLANAMRGTWTMRVYNDPKADALAEKQFLVEDFVPDRIEFDLASDDTGVAFGETAEIRVDGRFLYGAPAAGLEVEGEVNIAPVRAWAAFPGYLFGLADEEDYDATSRMDLDEVEPLDAEGRTVVQVPIEELPSTTRLLEAKVVVRVRESGGRAVERDIALAVAPEAEVIGVRPEFSGGEVPEGSIARFRVIAVDPDGNRVGMAGLNWSMVRIVRNYQWYRQDGSWNYEPVTFTEAVANGNVAATTTDEAVISVPVDWGRYRLEIETADPAGPATSVEFTAGWYVDADSTETPDALEMALDRDSYSVGDVARLQVSPKFSGKLLVAVGADRLIETFTADIPVEGGTVELPVGREWGAGAYVTATLFRPGDSVENRMPNRAIGVKWVAIDPGERRLEVSLDTPAQILPRGPLSIPVTVAGLDAGETAYVTIAAVDVGILNLTRYTPPDPVGWYFGQRKLGLELRDMYGRLIDGSLGATGRIRTGGDGGMVSEGSPPTEELVAFFEGPVRIGPDGKAVVSFDIPQFNGTARVMAVAWTKEAVGHAASDVIVRDPVVVTAGIPRFLAPGDRSRIRLDIANTDGPAGTWQVNVATAGGLSLVEGAPETVDLASGERKALFLPVSATRTGDAGLTVTLVHETGAQVVHAMALPVRPGAMPVTTRRTLQLAASGGSITVDRELLADSILDGAYVSLGVSPVSAFDIPSLLMSLDRYPYGCAEQTTSRALPLLYVSELSASAGMQDDPALRERVGQAILRVLAYQSSSGSFGLWGPGYGDLWLDAYVSDFLTRARELDYTVPAEAMQKALENLQNQLSYTNDVKAKGSEIAYSLYVLARNRKASVGDLRYYADTQIDDFASPMARAQLAAALALYGDSERAERAFGAALRLAEAGSGPGIDRGDYGSALRDGAAMLALAAETRPSPSLIPQMISFVSTARQQVRYLSTQDEAWLLLAARAIRAGSGELRLEVDGAPHDGSYSRQLTGAEIETSPITVRNIGGNPVDAVVTTVAAPAQPLPAGGEGFTITRTYYNLDGTEANVTEAVQNERYLVVIKATEMNAWPSRVLVSDLLPAGFEIDNPRLVGSAELSNFDWLGQTDAAHTEFRNDRFVAAFDRSANSDRDMVMAYVVRAVTPGVYVHPAASVEDMYRPQFSGRTASGMMEVVADQ